MYASTLYYVLKKYAFTKQAQERQPRFPNLPLPKMPGSTPGEIPGPQRYEMPLPKIPEPVKQPAPGPLPKHPAPAAAGSVGAMAKQEWPAAFGEQEVPEISPLASLGGTAGTAN